MEIGSIWEVKNVFFTFTGDDIFAGDFFAPLVRDDTHHAGLAVVVIDVDRNQVGLYPLSLSVTDKFDSVILMDQIDTAVRGLSERLEVVCLSCPMANLIFA